MVSRRADRTVAFALCTLATYTWSSGWRTQGAPPGVARLAE